MKITRRKKDSTNYDKLKRASTDKLLDSEFVAINVGKQYPTTQKMIDKLNIPQEDLALIIGSYRVTSIRSFIDSSQKHRVYFPKSEIKKIKKALEDLKKINWIIDDRIIKIINYIKVQMAFSKNGSQYLASHLKKKNVTTGGRKLGNPELDLLTATLVLLLKEKTKKPHYRDIADFLNEQKITEDATEDSIKGSYDRSRKDLEKIAGNIRRNTLLMRLKIELLLKSKPQSTTSDFNENIPDWIFDIIYKSFPE